MQISLEKLEEMETKIKDNELEIEELQINLGTAYEEIEKLKEQVKYLLEREGE